MRTAVEGPVSLKAKVALTLSVPTLVRSGGRSVIGLVTSGSAEPGAPLTRACPAPSTGAARSLAGAGGSPSRCLNGHTGQGSVNGIAIRMTNRAATSFLSSKNSYSSAFKRPCHGPPSHTTTRLCTDPRPFHEIPAHEHLADALPRRQSHDAPRKRAIGKAVRAFEAHSAT
jgi:hypothetical protein